MSKATIEITSDNFEKTIDRDGIVLLDWWAPWCGPCKAFGPVFEKAAESNPDIAFGKVNTEDQPDLAGAFNIRSIPTLRVFRDRVLVFSQPGMLPAPVLANLIGKVRALDMAKVHKDIEESEKKNVASA